MVRSMGVLAEGQIIILSGGNVDSTIKADSERYVWPVRGGQ